MYVFRWANVPQFGNPCSSRLTALEECRSIPHVIQKILIVLFAKPWYSNCAGTFSIKLIKPMDTINETKAFVLIPDVLNLFQSRPLWCKSLTQASPDLTIKHKKKNRTTIYLPSSCFSTICRCRTRAPLANLSLLPIQEPRDQNISCLSYSHNTELSTQRQNNEH